MSETGPQPPTLSRDYLARAIARMRDDQRQHLDQANALAGRIDGFEEILSLMPPDPPMTMAELVDRARDRALNGALGPVVAPEGATAHVVEADPEPEGDFSPNAIPSDYGRSVANPHRHMRF